MYAYGKVGLSYPWPHSIRRRKIRAKPGKKRRKLGAIPDLMLECMKRAQAGKLDGFGFCANPSVV